MAENDKVLNVYNALVKEGYDMEPVDEFRENLKNPRARKGVYDALVKEGYDMAPYEKFEANIGYAKLGVPYREAAANDLSTLKPRWQGGSTPTPQTQQAKTQQAKTQQTQQAKTQQASAKQRNAPLSEASKARMMEFARGVSASADDALNRFDKGVIYSKAKAGLNVPTRIELGHNNNVVEARQPINPQTEKAEKRYLTEAGNEYSTRAEAEIEQNLIDSAKRVPLSLDISDKQIEASQKPASAAIAAVWKEAEEGYEKDAEKNMRGSYGGLRATDLHEASYVSDILNYHKNNVSRMTHFDLQKMMDRTWQRAGKQITQSIVAQLEKQHPNASYAQLMNTAEGLARQMSDNAVYKYAVAKNAPRSTLEYFLKTAGDANLISTIERGLASREAGTTGDLAAYEQAMSDYGKNHRVAQIGGSIAGMAGDPVALISGGVGALAAKGALNLGGRLLFKKAATNVGTRLFGSTLGGRVAAGAAGGATNFGLYEGAKEAESQFVHGGHSAGDVLKATGRGLLLGSVSGTASPLIGNVADKMVKATSSTAGKVGIRAGELATSAITEGTIFSLPEWLSGESDKMDVWTDNMAMVLGFKAQHLVKSAPSVIAGLRPVADPKTQAERNHNRMSFIERLRKQMNASQSDIAFTRDEKEELRRQGYGELAGLFKKKPPVKVENPALKDSKTATFDIPEAKDLLNKHPELDGYVEMERLMQDPTVSQSTRAKAYYMLTGRQLPMSTVTGYRTEKDEHGNVVVKAVTAAGEVVTSKRFSDEAAANREQNAIKRQALLNTVDVGEQYAEQKADDKVFQAAIDTVAPGADLNTVKRNYAAVKAGDKDAVRNYADMVKSIDEFLEKNKGIADSDRSEAIRTAIKEKTGVDVDKALKKGEGKCNETEKAAVDEYVKRLYFEEREAGEKSEEDAIHDRSRLLESNAGETTDKTDETEPTAGEESNSPAAPEEYAKRMNEALQRCEDAFGSNAEERMNELQSDPWSLANDPNLTEYQQDTVLEYIKAKSALDKAQDVADDPVERKRRDVENEVGLRTNKESGMIQPAVMRIDGRAVYIIKGDVVVSPDGEISAEKSDRSIIVRDAETGEYKFVSPNMIGSVGEAIDPQEELKNAYAGIKAEQEQQRGGNEAQGEPQAQTGENAAAGGTETTGEQPTALSRVPVDEKTGEPAFERADPETALDALNEVTEGNEENTRAIVEAQVAQAEAALKALKKKAPTKKAATLKGSPMQMAKAQQEADAAYNAAMEQYNAQVSAAEEAQRAWTDILSLMNERKANEAAPVEEKAAAEESKEKSAVERTKQAVNDDGDTNLSKEKDENGRPFIKADNGTTVFGEITEESGLTAAPIKLSEGVQDENTGKGYGLVHIEANHGEQIRKAGFASVNEFVSYVATNYDPDNIRVGKRRTDGSETFLIQATDEHDNTLFIELSKDGSYWNVNSGGVFRKGYSNKKGAVAKTEPLQPNNAVSSGSSLSANERDGITNAEPNGKPTAPADKVTDKAIEKQEAGGGKKLPLQADARKESGVPPHTVSPKLKAKWDAAPKIEGNANAITLEDGTTLRGHYVLTEAGAATASHDVNNGYEPTEGFPVDENGESVNDRDYKRDKDAQRMVRDIADNYDSRALQSPVVVSKDGIVLSGNNRTMPGEIAAQQGTDKAYIDHLKEFGRMYGFTPEQVEGMKHPRVVFVPDEELPYDAGTFARFNAESRKRQNKAEHAVKLGKTVPDNVFGGIVGDIARYDRLSDYYADSKAVSNAISRLLDAGVINEMQLPELRTGNSLSASGKELIENTLIGKAFQSSPDAVRQIIGDGTLRQSVIMALNEITYNRTLAKSGYDLIKELAAAIDLVYRARTQHPVIFKKGVPVSPYGRQEGLFDDEFGDSRVTDGITLLLADLLNGSKTADLRKVLSVYNQEAAAPASGQMDIFSGERISKEQILKNTLEHFRNETPRELQAIIDAAVAERKRRAKVTTEQRGRSKTGEQAKNAVKSSGGNTKGRSDQSGERRGVDEKKDSIKYHKGEEDYKQAAQELGVDESDLSRYAEGMREKNTVSATTALRNLRARYIKEHAEEKKALMEREGISGLVAGRRLFEPIEKAVKERYGDVDVLLEERRKRIEQERNVMEAARRRAEEEERKREARLEELAGLTDEDIDKRYADALEKGDEAAAREMLDEAARRKGYDDAESNYQGVGAWSAPSDPGFATAEERRADVGENGGDVNLEDIAHGYSPVQEEMYSHPEKTGFGDEAGIEAGHAINNALNALKAGKKDVKIKVYRAVPTSVKEGKLRNGDWVTPSRKYAEMHGEHRLGGKYRIIETEVSASELWFDGNDIREWGYDNGKGYRYKNAKNNRKLNDLVTRDDKGNVISPSKRFNSRKADERYQKSEGREDGLTPEEKALRDALTDHLRKSGIEVIADEKEGQRVLDMAGEERDTAAPGEVKLLKAYHGSGADFDEFDLSHVGEGTGDRVHGYGVYLTKNHASARTYAIETREPQKPFEVDWENFSQDELLDYLTEDYGDANLAKRYLNTYLNDLWSNTSYAEKELKEIIESYKGHGGYEDLVDCLENALSKGIHISRDSEPNPTSIYTVEIPNDNGRNYLKEGKSYKGKDLAGIADRLGKIVSEYHPLKELSEKIREMSMNGDSLSGRMIYNSISDIPGYSDKTASHILSQIGFVGINYAEPGDTEPRNYVIFNEKDAKITDHVRFFRTGDGKAYGFTVGGKIYIDPRLAGAETPIHEYSHLWAAALRKGNTKEWKNVVGLMKGTSVWEEVKRKYPELKTDDEVADEVIAHYSGRRGAERLREEMRKASESNATVGEKAKAVSALQRVKEALSKFWKGVADFLHIHYTTPEEVADRVLKDLLDGVDPRKYGKSGNEGVRFSAKKRRALETVSVSHNEKHQPTVVSSADGVKVLKELDKAKEKYENQSNRTNTFLGDAAKALGAERHGSASEYATFETKNGQIVTIRLANHNAKVSNFDNRNESEGISIVVSPKGNSGMTDDGKAHVVEYYYNAIKLRRAEGKPLADILRAIKQVLYSGEFKDPTGLAERQEVNEKDVIRFQLVGERGAEAADRAEEATTRIDNLRVAREMEEAGKDAKAVKMATGWERGADGKWRYEIPDIKYHPKGDAGLEKLMSKQPWAKELEELEDRIFDGENLSEKEEARFNELAEQEKQFKADFFSREKPHLADWVENEELFAAYPELKNTEIVFTDQPAQEMGGYYSERNNRIVVNTASAMDADSVIAHEIQHAIQRMEGFAKGGNPESIEQEFLKAKAERAARAYASELEEKAKELGEDYNQVAVEKALIKEYEDMNMSDELPDKETRIKGFNYFARGYADRSLDDAIKRFRLNESVRGDFNPNLEYFKLAGEVEARNVQKRMNMTPEERRASLAKETEDEAREDQILLREGDAEAKAIVREDAAADVPTQATEEEMTERVEDLSKKLGTPVRIIRTEEEAEALPSARQRRQKGSYNTLTGEVTIVVPNNANLADIENTFIHEVVGHDGLRVLFPTEEKLNNALDELYRVSENGIKETIDREARKMYEAEVDRLREKKRKEHEAKGEDANASYYADMAEAHAEANKKREQFKRDATEEYGADLAGRIGDNGFEKMSAEELTFWGKLKAMLQKALQKLLAGLKIPGKKAWGDKEWAFVLHEAYKRKKNGGRPTVFDAADTEVMKRKTGFDEAMTNGDAVKKERNEELNRVNERFNEQVVRLTEENADKTVLSLGRPSAKLQSAGVKDKPMKLYGNKVMKKMRKHGFALEELRDLPKAVANPITVFNNYQREGNRSILTELETKDGNFLVTLELGKDGDIDFNIVSSVFGKGFNNIVDWYNKGYATYIDKEKALSFLYHQSAPIAATAANAGQSSSASLSSASQYVQQEIDKQVLDDAAKVVENFENPKVSDGNVADNEGLLFRDGDSEDYEKAIARDTYERRVKTGLYQTVEALQDSMLGLKEAMKSVLKAEGKKMYIEDVADYENPYRGENLLSSVNKVQSDVFDSESFNPLLKEVAKLAKTADERAELTDYMMAKHGLERNEVLAGRAAEKDARKEFEKELRGATRAVLRNPLGKDAQEELAKVRKEIADRKQELYKENRKRDYAGLTALTDMGDVGEAEREAKRMADDYESKNDTAELWKRINDVSRGILKKTYESGLISRETYNDIRSMYKNYIPLRGFDETTSEEHYAYLDDRTGTFSAPIKTAKGRKSKADDPIVNLKVMADSAILQCNRNVMVKQKFLNFALNHPSDLISVSDLWLAYDKIAGEWKPVNTGDVEDTEPLRADDSAQDVERKMRKFDEKMAGLAAMYPEECKKQKDNPEIPYRTAEKRDLREHQVLVKRDGKVYVLTVNGNPRAAQAVNGKTNPDNESSGVFDTVARAGEYVNRQLASFYTTRNPDFLLSNFIRDSIYSNTISWIKESPGYAAKLNKNWLTVANYANMVRLFRKWNAGTLDRNDRTENLFYQFMMNGGETGFVSLRDIEKRRRDIAREVKMLNGKLPIRKLWKLLGERIDEFNRAAENSARFAAFITSREVGRSLERSAYDAKEISVNFNKKGSGSKFFRKKGQTFLGNTAALASGFGRSLQVFWNAAIQGATNFGRVSVRHKKKMLAAMSILFSAGLMNAVLGGKQDDDDNDNEDGKDKRKKNGSWYYNYPEFTRFNNIIFRLPYSDDLHGSIPLPPEYSSVFGMGVLAGSIISGNVHYSGGEVANHLAGLMSKAMPLDFTEGGGGLHALIPSFIKPAWEVYTNSSWTGLPIYKKTTRNENMPEWTKVYKNANSTLVGVSKDLNELTGGDAYTKGWADVVNPASIEYMLNGYLGGMYKTIDQLQKMGEMALGKREFDPRSVMLLNRVVKKNDERMEQRAVNNEYHRIQKDCEELLRRLRAYGHDTKAGIFDYAAKINALKEEESFKILPIYYNYNRYIEAYSKRMKDEQDEKEKEKFASMINDLKSAVVSKADSIRNVNVNR